MAILLALATSALYGAADFLGAVASRRSAALAVSALSQGAGLTAMLLLVPILPAAHPTRADLGWGILLGVVGACSLGLFFSALTVGRIGVVAPIAAAVGDAVPVSVGMALGEHPSAVAFGGILLAVGAIVLIGWEPNPLAVAGDAAAPADGRPASQVGPRLDRSVALALGSGVAIGLFYTILHRTSADAGIWPLLIGRLVSCPLLFVAARAARQPVVSTRPVLGLVLASGLLDITANGCYYIAVHHGPLGIVATLASLYPAATVLLAFAILREHLHRRQLAGLAVGTAAIVLISAG